MFRHLLMFVLVALATSTLFADVPRTISYQGRLTNSGAPINGVRNVTFTIYNGGGTPIWNSGSVNVTFTEGLFTVELGQAPQPSLFVDSWSSDTAMSLGVTIAPNPELSPRLRFKTAPYAIHALTAESANSGGGWLRSDGLLRLEDPNDSISIGPAVPGSKVAITATNNLSGLRVYSAATNLWSPALEVEADNTTTAIFRQGLTGGVPAAPIPAAYFASNGPNKNAIRIESYGSSWPAVMIDAPDPGDAIRTAALYGYGIDAWFGKGIRAAADSATAIRAESNCDDNTATVLSSTYTGTRIADHIAVSGYSRPVDYFGFGGRFESGYKGVVGVVYPDAGGDKWYTGVVGEASGGNGSNYGVYGNATGTGTNHGVYATASGGTINWAGYFEGDINVTGNVVKAASSLAIDHPTDPDNEFLQQAEVVSDNLSAVYSGNTTLGSDGSAVVQLPDWIESFCGDFRYQLTCVGGYAPVYVASKIANSQFAIAGGTSGLEVSWQVTGIRKDKYAQANPLQVEKRKTASEQGKFLHPELYGYSADRSLSSNPDRDPSAKAKNDALRAATAELAKPSTLPKQPQLLKK